MEYTKICSKCKRELPATTDYFYKHKRGKYELQSQCKECMLKYANQYREDNAEHIKEYNKQWREDNPEYMKQYIQTEKGKQVYTRAIKKYQQTEKGKESQRKNVKKYQQTEKGKESQRKGHKKQYDKYLEENGLERSEGSYGEQKVRQVLRESNLTFSEQHRFDDCKFKLPLPFDFYIPSLNTIIEYDGIQHFETTGGWSDEDHLKETIIRDTIKNDYCRRNNIKLIRIPYWEFDNIEQILSDLL